MSASSSPWTLPATKPVPVRVQQALAAAALGGPEPAIPAPQPRRSPAALSAAPGFTKQLFLGVAIFAGVLAASLPFALVSEGVALGAAVGVGGVLVAIFARRLRIALMIATLMAVLGAFAATHSVHLALHPNGFPNRLAVLAPAAGETSRPARPAQPATAIAIATPVRTEIGGTRIPVAGWAFPGALLLFWVVGFAALAANRKLARWAWHRMAQRPAKTA